MAESRNSFLSKLAAGVTSDGDISSDAIAPSVTQSLGTSVYDSALLLPIVGNTAGDTAFVKSTSRLYIHSGLGWYNVAVINNTPTVQSILDSDGGTTPFSLATDGTATTITITAQDSDGDPLTYNYSADSNFAGLATLSQDANVFTITPFSSDSATTTSGTITFSVTDGINTATPSAQAFTLNFVSALWDETVLSIGTSSTNSLDNSTFIDRSTNAHTVTPTGSPVQTAFHPYLDNWSAEFDGSNYFTAPSHTSFDIGTGDFTFECWVYKETNNRIMLQAITGAGLSISINTSGNIEVNRTLTAIDFTFTAGIVSNTWTHIAVTRSGTDLRAFKDGVLLGTQTSTTDYGQGVCYVGVDGNGTSDRYIGFISDFRLIKGTAVYTSAFTPSTSKLTAVSGTSLLACQSNRFIDNSTNSHTITVGGNPVVSAFNPFGQESEYAAGENKGSVDLNGDYLSLSSSDVGNLGTADYTVQFWIYKRGTTNDCIIDLRGGDLNHGVSVEMDTKVTVFYGGTPFQDTGSFDNYAWNHIAVCRSSAVLKGFINGEQIFSVADTNNRNNTNNTSKIGVNYSNAQPTDALLSDIKVSHVAEYISAFTPPTSPLGNTNAKLYLPMDNAGIFDKTGINSIEYQANVVTSTSQTKYSSTSILHDNDVTLITLPTGLSADFTIEGWFYVNDTTVVSGFFQFRDDIGQSNSNEGLSFGKGSNFDYRYASGTAVNTGTISTIQGQWFHFAYARTSNTLKAFINGTQDLSVSDSTDYSAFKYLHLGMFFSSGYTGDFYVENFQVLNGVAKYTTNFTVPNKEQGRTYQAED